MEAAERRRPGEWGPGPGVPSGVHDIPPAVVDSFAVPGALEIPVCASIISKKKIYDAIIAIGAVIKGETYHFELVANECGRGCMNVALESGTPVIFEVLCVNNIRQAKARAGNNDKNKGIEAAITALKMLQVLFQVKAK